MSSRLALIVLASAVACGGRPPPAPSVEVPIARVPLEEPALEAAIVAHDATPTFPDAVASYRPTERLERGLRVPLPRGVGLPRCDLYIQAEVMRDDAYWVAEDIHRIAVAGEDCPTHLAFDQAVPSHRLTVAGGWLAKPGGPPVPPGKPQLFDLLDVTFDGVPELRISDLSHASHHVFLMRVPGRAELVHLAALDYLPNLRIDPLGRRLVSEEVMETFSWLRREYAWERGALVLMRRVRTWRGTNPRFEPIGDENATWRLEVERRGDAYEVVFDGLQTPAPVVPLAPVVATPPATPPAITGRPIFPDALAPKMLAPSAPLVGLRVPLPTAPGIPKCDLYLEGEVSTQGEESWAEKIERITVAGDDC
ncbi:MAG: hypothetical protein KC731_01010, partial [Myxococcales bacterium]|nr:hypothetical protein [Myxococcales bacterium]